MKVGILGGGQLGRMLGVAAIPLGMSLRFFDQSSAVPACAVGLVQCGNFEDSEALALFCKDLDVVTFEFENIPLSAALTVSKCAKLLPSPLSLQHTQDRFAEKRLFKRLGIPTAPVHELEWKDEPTLLSSFDAAMYEIGYPAVIKSRTLGYDGRGQCIVQSRGDYLSALDFCRGRDVIIEEFVAFTREVSLISVRAKSEEMRFYPLVENVHRGGILIRTTAPAHNVSKEPQSRAESAVRAINESLQHIGVLTVEFFEKDGALIANEIAPRVHNSGHWTIEGAATSQFENHIRAITGLPLGDTCATTESVMFNLIGKLPSSREILNVAGTHLHLYQKEPRAKRKLGHVTICQSGCADRGAFNQGLSRLEGIVG